MAASNLRQAFVTGSGAVLDTVTNVSISDTRIRALHASGVGTFLITGTSTDNRGNVTGTNIKFVLTTNSDAGDLIFPENGLRMTGTVKVSAPTSAATVAIFYG
jgi:hypothetical protein